MKYLHYLLLWWVISSPLGLFASDTLFVVTNKGSFLIDVASGVFIPFSEDKNLNIVFSTEGFSYCSTSPKCDVFYDSNISSLSSFWSLSLRDSLGTRTIVNYKTKPDNSGYLFSPLGWNHDYTSLYLYSTEGDANNNEKGIYEYSCIANTITQRISAFSYYRIPLFGYDRKCMYYLRNDGDTQSIISYGTQTHVEKVLLTGLRIFRFGIILPFSVERSYSALCATDPYQPTLRSPFLSGVTFCVTRMGFDNVLNCENACSLSVPPCSFAPYCEGHCQSGCVNCRDAVDMDPLGTPYSYNGIRASADGYVVRAQSTCPVSGMGQGYGFGYHVVIRHGAIGDESAPETLYAHLAAVYVEEGEYVLMGQMLGELGNSQVLDCDNDGVLDCDCESESGTHVHYEYHSGTGVLYSTSDIFAPIFSDIGGCVPQPNSSYTPNNFGLSNITPSNSTVTIIGEVDCEGIVPVTWIGTSCDCCVSIWNVQGQQIYSDTLTIYLPLEIINNQQFVVGRVILAPCAGWNLSGEKIVGPLSLVNDCIFGCLDPDACNFNPSAEYNDDTCDYSCLSLCVEADINEDGIVNTADLIILFGLIGSSIYGDAGDLNNDGEVGVGDITIFFDYFGEICD